MDGWISLHRKILQSRAFNDPQMLKVWIWCLASASHTEHYLPMTTGRGQTDVLLKPGQFVFGRESAAKKLKMNPSSVRNRMKRLKKWGNLDIQAHTHFSIVTVLNWDKYQFALDGSGQPSGQPKDNQRPTKGQPKDTFNNGNNGKNDNTGSGGDGCAGPREDGKVPRPKLDIPLDTQTAKERTWELLAKLNLDDDEEISMLALVRWYPPEVINEKEQMTLDYPGSIANKAAYFTDQVMWMKAGAA